MAEEFQKKSGRDRLIYISVVVIILLIILSLFVLKQNKKADELTGAVTAALQDAEGAGGSGGGGSGDSSGGVGAAGSGSTGAGTSKTDTTSAKTTTTLKPIVLAAPNDIIKAIVELRQQSNANEFVKVAGLVTSLNDQFSAGNIDSVAFSWQDVLNCVYDKCPDAKYAKLVDDYVLQDRANSKFMLTHRVVELYNLWNGRNIIQFSESVTNVNTMVAAMNNAKVTEKWKAVVACKGTCSDFPDKIFDMILAVNAA